MTSQAVWFWQRMISPLMSGLAEALARLGHHVVYVPTETLSEDRIRLGWVAPKLNGVKVVYGTSPEDLQQLAASAPPDAMHIVQGIRANGMVSVATETLRSRGIRYWVFFETVEERPLGAYLKRAVYRVLFARYLKGVEGILAVGHSTPDWLRKRGVPKEGIFPFTYFVQAPSTAVLKRTEGPFRFLYVGQLIPRKRVDLVLKALQQCNSHSFTLDIVGSGPEERALRALALALPKGRVRFRGAQPIEIVRSLMAQADTLILPSRHDGWGAVVSEALMAGTPVVCSTSCGAAEVAVRSSVGHTFPSGDLASLVQILNTLLHKGPQDLDVRIKVSNWARTLNADSGARYVQALLAHTRDGAPRPSPPWL